MNRIKHVMALDLIDDPTLIEEYEKHHKAVWPDILSSIRKSGIEEMEIFRVENRLFMIMHVNDEFDFEKKELFDSASTKVQEWEKLMWEYQKALPGSKPGEKWRRMECIFKLTS